MRNSRKNRRDIPMNQPAIARLSEDQTTRFLLRHIENANLQRPARARRNASDLGFSSNQDFWRLVLETSHLAPRWVVLRHFQIADWFPRTPGLYHTRQAAFAREEAEKYLYEENGIYLYDPHGKTHMINGGLGSVRFKPISIFGQEYWLCTATSDGRCHTGIPLAIPDRIMENFGFRFNNFFKIIGQFKFLPELLEHRFYHSHRIPQIYLSVESIEISGKERARDMEISPMVFFTGEIEELRGRPGGNVTYVRCTAGSTNELDRAAEWLSQYASRYGGEIITNFDQQRPTFQDAPFSLQNVMDGQLDERILYEYHIDHADIICKVIQNIHTEAMAMTKIDVKLGDGTTIHGDFVVANSIRDSFNKVASADISSDLKDLLKELTKQVGIMSQSLPEDTSKQVARDLETLTTEATSKNPRKQWWQLSLDGLKQAATTVGEIGKPILEIADKIIPLLAGQS